MATSRTHGNDRKTSYVSAVMYKAPSEAPRTCSTARDEGQWHLLNLTRHSSRARGRKATALDLASFLLCAPYPFDVILHQSSGTSQKISHDPWTRYYQKEHTVNYESIKQRGRRQQ